MIHYRCSQLKIPTKLSAALADFCENSEKINAALLGGWGDRGMEDGSVEFKREKPTGSPTSNLPPTSPTSEG